LFLTSEELLLNAYRTDPDSPRLLKWINEHYETLEFPDEPVLFGELAVYVRHT
jgi:hypothetical protein